MFIVTGVIRTRDGGFYNLLAQRKGIQEAEALSVKLNRNKSVRHIKVQTLKQWENEGCPGQLSLFTA